MCPDQKKTSSPGTGWKVERSGTGGHTTAGKEALLEPTGNPEREI
jgi:hypothetical protein